MNFDLVKIVNKYIENDRTFVLFDGFAYIFWEGVWLQYATEANLQNGIYDRDLKLRKRLNSFSLPDISGDEWVEISFKTLKNYSKYNSDEPDMILGLALHSDGPKVHVYSSDLSLYLASKFDQFEAKIVSKYLALLKKSDGDAMVFYCSGPDGGMIRVSLGRHQIYFLTKNLREKLSPLMSEYDLHIIREETEDDEDKIYLEQPLALEA